MTEITKGVGSFKDAWSVGRAGAGMRNEGYKAAFSAGKQGFGPSSPQFKSIAQTQQLGRQGVKNARKEMSLPKRAVALTAQYPARAATAATATAGTGYQMKKNDTTGPFGIEVISKAGKFPLPHGKGAMNPQARKQLASLKDVKGSKSIQLRHAKAKAGEKFQNKGI